MSADDSIEIEFPSLNQPAPQLVERVASKRAPGPIEAQLSTSSSDDDLSWLSAIFADDDDADDDARKPEDSDDYAPDDLPVELPVVSDGPPANLSEGSADVFKRDSIEDDSHDITPPLDALDHYLEDDLEDDLEDVVEAAVPDEPELLIASDRDLVVADSAPIDDGTNTNHPELSSPSKKVTGFREEIMSTFSQMYN